MHRVLIISILLLVSGSNLFSQFPKSESAPFKVKWYKMQSPNFNVFFYKGMDSVANYTINYLENSQSKIKQNPDDKIRKTNIILHGENSISNAFVTSSPRRSEFYANAKPESSHFLHNNNWIDLLVNHEYRHLVQRELAYNNKFNKAVHFLFGQSLAGSLAKSTMPVWYWEGDAVDYETREGNFGRGKIPKFTLTSKMNKSFNSNLNYDKQILGSYKSKTPNVYESGYLMVKYLKDNYGLDTFNKIVNKANKQSYLPLPFYRALKKETGLNYKALYNISLNEGLNYSFDSDVKAIHSRNSKIYSDFKYPKELKDGRVVFIKQGMGSYKEIQLIDENGKNNKLIIPGMIKDIERVPNSNNVIGWIEFDKDPRWDKRTYSVIKLFDINKKKIIKKSKKNFYSSFDISQSGRKIIALNNNIDGTQSLQEFDNEFNLKKSFDLRGGVYSSIKFVSENNLIGIKTSRGIKTVFLLDLDKYSFDYIKETSKNIGWPSLKEDWLVYSSDNKGLEEIFFYNIKSGKDHIIPGNAIGRYYPSISQDGKFVYFSEMTKNGFDIKKLEINKGAFKQIDFIEMLPQKESSRTKKYEAKKLNSIFHFLRPINWGIIDYGFDLKGMDYITLGLESKNLFGTVVFNGGYKIDTRDKKNKRFFGISLQSLYPIIDMSIEGSNDFYFQDLILNDREGNPVDTIYNADINFKAKDLSLGLRLPLSYTKGKYFTNLILKSDYTTTRYYDYYTKALASSSGRFPLNVERRRNYISGLAYYSRRFKKPKRAVYSPYEQTLLIETKKTINRSDYTGEYFRSDIYLAFPGLVKHHSLRTKFRYENQKHINFSFRRNVDFVHGYTNDFLFNNFKGLGIEYENPLIYPEINIGPIVYIQRVRLISFINYGHVIGDLNANNYRFEEKPLSLGLELKFDVNFFRQSSIFDLGIRYSYVSNIIENQNPSTIEITLGSISF